MLQWGTSTNTPAVLGIQSWGWKREDTRVQEERYLGRLISKLRSFHCYVCSPGISSVEARIPWLVRPSSSWQLIVSVSTSFGNKYTTTLKDTPGATGGYIFFAA